MFERIDVDVVDLHAAPRPTGRKRNATASSPSSPSGEASAEAARARVPALRALWTPTRTTSTLP